MMILNVDVYPLVFVLTIICTSFYISMCTDIIFIALVLFILFKLLLQRLFHHC